MVLAIPIPVIASEARQSMTSGCMRCSSGDQPRQSGQGSGLGAQDAFAQAYRGEAQRYAGGFFGLA